MNALALAFWWPEMFVLRLPDPEIAKRRKRRNPCKGFGYKKLRGGMPQKCVLPTEKGAREVVNG